MFDDQMSEDQNYTKHFMKPSTKEFCSKVINKMYVG